MKKNNNADGTVIVQRNKLNIKVSNVRLDTTSLRENAERGRVHTSKAVLARTATWGLWRPTVHHIRQSHTGNEPSDTHYHRGRGKHLIRNIWASRFGFSSCTTHLGACTGEPWPDTRTWSLVVFDTIKRQNAYMPSCSGRHISLKWCGWIVDWKW